MVKRGARLRSTAADASQQSSRPPRAVGHCPQQHHRTVTPKQPNSAISANVSTTVTTVGATNVAKKNTTAKNKVKIVGVRRIWGTLKETTTRAVSSTITKVCGICPAKVKRSFKKNDTGRIFRWWFIVRDSEDVLSTLDTKWQQIQIHTSWKLEPCYISQPNEELPSVSSPNRSQAPAPLANHSDDSTNQPADNIQTNDAEPTVQLSSNEEEQATSHSPSPVSDSSSPANVYSIVW